MPLPLVPTAPAPATTFQQAACVFISTATLEERLNPLTGLPTKYVPGQPLDPKKEEYVVCVTHETGEVEEILANEFIQALDATEVQNTMSPVSIKGDKFKTAGANIFTNDPQATLYLMMPLIAQACSAGSSCDTKAQQSQEAAAKAAARAQLQEVRDRHSQQKWASRAEKGAPNQHYGRG